MPPADRLKTVTSSFMVLNSPFLDSTLTERVYTASSAAVTFTGIEACPLAGIPASLDDQSMSSPSEGVRQRITPTGRSISLCNCNCRTLSLPGHTVTWAGSVSRLSGFLTRNPE